MNFNSPKINFYGGLSQKSSKKVKKIHKKCTIRFEVQKK